MDAALRQRGRRRACPIAGRRAGWPSTTPARALGLGEPVGALEPGLRADLVVLDDDLQVKRVMRAGPWVEASDHAETLEQLQQTPYTATARSCTEPRATARLRAQPAARTASAGRARWRRQPSTPAPGSRPGPSHGQPRAPARAGRGSSASAFATA